MNHSQVCLESERQPLLGNMSSSAEGKSYGPTSGTANTDDDETSENVRPDDRRPRYSNKFAKICSDVLANVTLEPMLFLKMVAEGNVKVLADSLEIDRVCRVNLNYSATECRMMDDGNHTDMQNAVQRYQNTFNYHQTLMDSFIPLLIVLFVGPLSDRYGRKPAMVGVLIGFIGFSLVYILTALSPTWPVQVLYLATLFVDLGGSWVMFNVAVYSYIADITSVESRTKRMGFADAIWYLGSPIGTLLGGFVYKEFGYVAVYAMSAVLWTLCLMYTIFFIKENRRENEENENLLCQGNEGHCGPFRYVVLLFKTIFKKRSQNGHIHVMVLIGLKLGVFLVQGHQMFLWARKVLQWDATKYSLWVSVEDGSHQAGMVGWVWLGERLHLHDCTVANGGLLSIFMWSVTLACITGPSLWWLTILASFFGLLEASIEPAIRSMLTAVVGSGEEGKILTMLGILESAWLSVDRALYTLLYNTFVDGFPQINFVVQAGFSLLLILIFFLLKRNLLKRRASEEQVTPTSYEHCHNL